MHQNRNEKQEAIDSATAGPIARSRREILKWTAPLITIVVLPTHAQTTCSAAPIVVAPVPSKCAGSTLDGEARVEVYSDSVDITISDISHDAPSTDTISLPNLPVTVSSNSSTEIGWAGLGSDALICLPVNTITFSITYNCGAGTQTSTHSFILTEILAEVAP